MEKNETRSEMKKMIEGMMYHCREMTEFLNEHIRDEYFSTEEGKKILKCSTGINFNHITALMIFMNAEEKKKNEEKVDFEEILKGLL